MNLPATQDKIQRDLRSAIVRFLDTSPEKALLFRTSAILHMLKHYFEQELSRGDGDSYDKATAEEVLFGVGFALRHIRRDDDVEKWVADRIAAAERMTDEELDKHAKEQDALDALFKAAGKERWD
jgi:hypothetical protein